ncbi:MAG: dephospho-CoA kinase [Ferruginibacter sp.]|nr:dephospho-CoA kinase [Ferruginibacter sp.]
MLRIGLTGGIGSGKSTVARIFNILGAPVYDADSAAKQLMETYAPLKEKLVSIFGSELYSVTGMLNRKWLSDKVFENNSLLAKLNAAVHPETLRDSNEWMNHCTYPYAIKEAALIFESGADKSLDIIIGVSSPEALRIERVQNRDNANREDVLARMKKQMNEEEKLSRCQIIIINDEKEMLIPQVVNLHYQFLTGKF